jgi:hypothetical protein
LNKWRPEIILLSKLYHQHQYFSLGHEIYSNQTKPNQTSPTETLTLNFTLSRFLILDRISASIFSFERRAWGKPSSWNSSYPLYISSGDRLSLTDRRFNRFLWSHLFGAFFDFCFLTKCNLICWGMWWEQKVSLNSQFPPESFRLRQAWELMLLNSFLGCLMHNHSLIDFLNLSLSFCAPFFWIFLKLFGFYWC